MQLSHGPNTKFQGGLVSSVASCPVPTTHASTTVTCTYNHSHLYLRQFTGTGAITTVQWLMLGCQIPPESISGHLLSQKKSGGDPQTPLGRRAETLVWHSSCYLLVCLTHNQNFAGNAPFPRAGHIIVICLQVTNSYLPVIDLQ